MFNHITSQQCWSVNEKISESERRGDRKQNISLIGSNYFENIRCRFMRCAISTLSLDVERELKCRRWSLSERHKIILTLGKRSDSIEWKEQIETGLRSANRQIIGFLFRDGVHLSLVYLSFIFTEIFKSFFFRILSQLLSVESADFFFLHISRVYIKIHQHSNSLELKNFSRHRLKSSFLIKFELF